ncbi:MAG: cell division protein SepF [Acidimicrobiales bacterium]
MANGWRKAMTYLGLGPDDEYDDYDDVEPQLERAPVSGPERTASQRTVSDRSVAGRPSAGRAAQERSARGAVGRPPTRSPVRRPMIEPDDPDVAVVGTVRRLEPQPIEPAPGIGAITSAGPKRNTPVVRAFPANATAKPHVIAPTSFNEAQEIADRYKSNAPVIINMQAVDRDLARRLIDFASGLCYGLSGTMDKVANQVYLLTPANVEVSPEERRRLQDRGLYD